MAGAVNDHEKTLNKKAAEGIFQKEWSSGYLRC